MEFKLFRKQNTDLYCYGRLYALLGDAGNLRGLVSGVVCDTIEHPVRPFEQFRRGKTAIPAGRYRLLLTLSPRFHRALPLLANVPNFLGIRIHRGNSVDDSRGCILPGKYVGGGQLIQSTKAEKDVIALMDEQDNWLEVVDDFAQRADGGDAETDCVLGALSAQKAALSAPPKVPGNFDAGPVTLHPQHLPYYPAPEPPAKRADGAQDEQYPEDDGGDKGGPTAAERRRASDDYFPDRDDEGDSDDPADFCEDNDLDGGDNYPDADLPDCPVERCPYFCHHPGNRKGNVPDTVPIYVSPLLVRELQKLARSAREIQNNAKRR